MRRRAGVILSLILLLAVLASLGLGDSNLGPTALLRALVGRGDELDRTILWDLRLPRTLVGLAVGAGLAASGVTMQAFFRNPLASPGLLGVSAGGALGAVAVLALGWHASFLTVPLAAIAGAFLATGAVLVLARRGAGPEHLLLSGVALNAFFGAGTSFLLALSAGKFEVSGQILFWLMGGIENRTWEHVAIGLPGVLVCCALLLPLGRPMNLLSLGEPSAQSLGVDVRRLRWQLIALSTVLTALATAVGGVVGFVGLLVPHLLRLAFGPDHRRLLPLSMVGGAALVLLCDLPTRFVPGGLRLGAMTALVGGPFLLWMLRRNPC
ncbi:FecCD family ABC transporter permease [Mesoterricola silvestris]|uniref:ABC transporter permease n=1 Tax=Mesoterricola silvestris TaxID=2927979 RepID=A0AA48GSE0_9BACT|nr:iron ABC transporter permease [Mesoterricola silvestris]BDU70876.1 ABC transporter permease [Mesoterricola silvestris]